MARLYSSLLAAESDWSGSLTIEVPENTTIVLRDLEVFQSLENYDTSFYLNANGAHIWVPSQPDIPGDIAFQWTGRVVVPAGNNFEMVVSDGFVDFCLSGYTLSAP